jgi:hypothetical protein
MCKGSYKWRHSIGSFPEVIIIDLSIPTITIEYIQAEEKYD